MLAFGVVVSEQDAEQIERTNDAISRLGLVWRGLSNQLAVAAAPALEAVAEAMAAVARTTGPLGIAIRGLFENIGRLASIAGTFAAFMAGRWVAGLAAAALSIRGLATALVLLRGALIRTGIGALAAVLWVHNQKLAAHDREVLRIITLLSERKSQRDEDHAELNGALHDLRGAIQHLDQRLADFALAQSAQAGGRVRGSARSGWRGRG